jgi:hypothetical protein
MNNIFDNYPASIPALMLFFLLIAFAKTLKSFKTKRLNIKIHTDHSFRNDPDNNIDLDGNVEPYTFWANAMVYLFFEGIGIIFCVGWLIRLFFLD